MDLEKGVKECKTKMGKCYVCLEDYDKFYLSCNTCKDGKICFNCSDSLINSCYDNKNLLKCGLCRKEFDINRHTKIYNIKNIKVIKYLYISISFLYILCQTFRFNFFNFTYNNLYCNKNNKVNEFYDSVNICLLSLMILEKTVLWNISIQYRLLSKTSLCNLFNSYVIYDILSFLTSFLFFNTTSYKCKYDFNYINYFYVILWTRLIYFFTFINLYKNPIFS
jgi:hypothetical protein